MKIGGHDLSERVLIIAEIGVNHDGSVDRAIELVHAAQSAGADAIKLQIFTADRLMHRTARFAEYQKNRTDAVDPTAMLRQYELDMPSLVRIRQCAEQSGLLTIATPFSPEELSRLIGMGAAAVKIASPDLVNCLLIDEARKSGLPLILSTGASTRNEIDAAVRWLTERGGSPALLHCVSNYPTSPDDANLCWIDELKRFGLPVGYSDHTDEISAGAMAVMAGARIIEKHLTWNKQAQGPDHSASFDRDDFAEYVRLIRLAERMQGRPGRRVLECENDVRQVSRQGLVAKHLVAGRAIRLDDLTTQRPGAGVSPGQLDQILGKMPKHPIAAGDWIGADDVE